MCSVKNLLILVILMLSTACASVFSGVEQEMSFNSKPEGATVYVDGLEKGKTPLLVKIRKDEHKNITFKKTGFRDEKIILHSKFDPVGLLNLFVVTGFTTDALTGAMFEYAPGKYVVKLEKAGTKISRSNLQRDYNKELVTFVSKNYRKLKSQCHTNCNNMDFQTLSWLITKVYDQNNQQAKQYAIKALAISNNSLEFLRQLESDVKAETPQVVAIQSQQ